MRVTVSKHRLQIIRALTSLCLALPELLTVDVSAVPDASSSGWVVAALLPMAMLLAAFSAFCCATIWALLGVFATAMNSRVKQSTESSAIFTTAVRLQMYQ